jgi:hypothetical protein
MDCRDADGRTKFRDMNDGRNRRTFYGPIDGDLPLGTLCSRPAALLGGMRGRAELELGAPRANSRHEVKLTAA